MRNYETLSVWQKAHSLTLMIYSDVIAVMPAEEKFSLTQQIRRSAYSIPMNIAEGSGKHTNRDFLRYLDISLGSAKELEYSCRLIYDLKYISRELYLIVVTKVSEIKAMLISFIKFLREKC